MTSAASRAGVSRGTLLTILMLILTFNQVDRIALGLVLENIKSDLQLTDTELGVLTGIAFAFFYAAMGIPIARWADRGNRVSIITITTAVWSVAVALCAAATNFPQLMAIRVAVAVGEAGCVPPAHSLIADYFSRAERPKAIARYMLGVPLSLAIGYFAAGWLNELYGWRVTFIALGMPGVLLAIVARRCLEEPRLNAPMSGHLHGNAREQGVSVDPPSFSTVFRALAANATFRHLLLCFSLWHLFGYGLQQWMPAFFIRSHGFETGELGTWFALIYGIGSSVGLYVGGEIAVRFAANDERRQLVACAISFLLFPAVMAYAFMTSSPYLAFAALSVASLGAMAQGPMFATIQSLVPPDMRAMAIALVYLFANLIGMGLGPLAAGALSDALTPWFATESLRYSLLILCPGYFWAAWHLWRASRSVASDLRRANIAPTEPSAASLEAAAESSYHLVRQPRP